MLENWYVYKYRKCAFLFLFILFQELFVWVQSINKFFSYYFKIDLVGNLVFLLGVLKLIYLENVEILEMEEFLNI